MSDKAMAQTFSDFFVNKIETIRSDITNQQPTENQNDFDIIEDYFDKERLVEFSPVTEDETTKIITKSPCKLCELDPISTWLLR